jgi:hypothetical protein
MSHPQALVSQKPSTTSYSCHVAPEQISSLLATSKQLLGPSPLLASSIQRLGPLERGQPHSRLFDSPDNPAAKAHPVPIGDLFSPLCWWWWWFIDLELLAIGTLEAEWILKLLDIVQCDVLRVRLLPHLNFIFITVLCLP